MRPYELPISPNLSASTPMRASEEHNRVQAYSGKQAQVSVHWEEGLMRAIAILLLLLAVYNLNITARAQKSNECKLCRDSLQACLKNHSRTACNTEYGICMNHCRKK